MDGKLKLFESGLPSFSPSVGPRGFAAGGLAAALLVAGCSNIKFDESLPRGAAAYDQRAAAASQRPVSYQIGPYDLIEITTFNEPGLSFEEVPVDAEGAFSFPFLGRVDAVGLTPYELETLIKAGLDERYTRDAQVTVFVKNAASQVYAVEGSVESPGQFQYAGNLTLLDALARAGSPNDTARLSEVAVFRYVGGERYGAVFDLVAIRAGEVDDPAILPGDTIVVGNSAVREGWKNFITLTPVLNAFSRF